MRTKTYTVYKFNELSDEVQQKARGGGMTINLTYAKTITKQAGIKQNYQSLRNAYDKRDLKNIILNACLYLLINEHLGMNSLELAI